MRKNSFSRLFSFMGRALPRYVFGLLGLSLTGFLFLFFASLGLRQMFDAIGANDFHYMLLALRNIGAMAVISMLFAPVFQYMVESAAARTTGNIRNRVFGHIQRLPIGYFKNKHSGDLISRLTNDITETEKAYAKIFVNLCANIIIGIGSVVVMYSMDWRLATFAVVVGFLTVFLNSLLAKVIKRLSDQIQNSLGEVTERISDLLAGFRVIRSFNLAKFMLRKYEVKADQVYELSYKRVGIQAILGGFNVLMGIFTFMGLFAFGSYLVIIGEVEFGVIMMIVQLQNGVSQLFRTMTTFITELQTSLAAAERLYEVLEIEVEPATYQLALADNNNRTDILPKKYEAIRFEQVGFHYTEGEMVLKDVSFSVPEGHIVALAGPSGGGKSTIIKLILGFYQPVAGNIWIGGKSISDQTLLEVRDQIAYVPQDAFLFAGTIADNISYGAKDATMEEIQRAAKLANAHDFIMELEKGYNALVGERGTHLSGGQRQRIAIARAILKDAPILLLDEATSALDNESEYLVQEALKKLMVGRTTLVIAHRLSTIQDADKILVIQDGIIVEEGAHAQLVEEKGGVYQKLYYQQYVLSEKHDAVNL